MSKVKPKIPAIEAEVVPKIKKFVLNRKKDATGTSGTGYVAVGVMFSSGHCVLEWNTDVRSIGVYNSSADVEAIHGHEGQTVLEWCDEL